MKGLRIADCGLQNGGLVERRGSSLYMKKIKVEI